MYYLQKEDILNKDFDKNSVENYKTPYEYTIIKAIREINNQPISSAEKTDKIESLSNAIQDAILSDNERELMHIIKKQVNNLPYQSVKVIC